MKYLKVIKSKDLKSRLCYPAKLSFTTEGQIKSSLDKKKLKMFISIKPVLQEMLEGLPEKENIKNMNNKMAITTYLSTITLNVNVLNALIKI